MTDKDWALANCHAPARCQIGLVPDDMSVSSVCDGALGSDRNRIGEAVAADAYAASRATA